MTGRSLSRRLRGLLLLVFSDGVMLVASLGLHHRASSALHVGLPSSCRTAPPRGVDPVLAATFGRPPVAIGGTFCCCCHIAGLSSCRPCHLLAVPLLPFYDTMPRRPATEPPQGSCLSVPDLLLSPPYRSRPVLLPRLLTSSSSWPSRAPSSLP